MVTLSVIEVLKKAGMMPTEKDIDDIIMGLDKNKDGKVQVPQ
jgi:hypothetical protein